MSFRKPTSIKDLLFHLLIIIGGALVIVLFVFFLWLPVSTNHGETISVPDIQGMTIDEIEEFLEKRSLRFEVTADSSYSPDYPALAVLRQVPSPDTKVKENRKIYVTLNAKSPPKVRMPKVEDLSLKSAQMVLKSYDLILGEVKYVPDVFFGVVHEARLDDRLVLEGEEIEKGSVIDLIAGDGYGNTVFQSPDLIGLDLEEASVAIIGSGLKVGKISFIEKSMAGFYNIEDPDSVTISYREIPPNTIQNQYPKPFISVKIGDPIDLWVYKPDSLSSDSPTILDNQ